MDSNNEHGTLVLNCSTTDGDSISFTKWSDILSIFLYEIGGQGTVNISHDDAKKLSEWINNGSIDSDKSPDVQPTNEWYDYANQLVIGEPTNGTSVLVNCHHQGVKNAIVVGAFNRWIWCDVVGFGLDTFDNSLVKPVDYDTRKTDAARKRAIK
jgi:hypothetical protein